MNELLSRIRTRFARIASASSNRVLGSGFVYVPSEEEGAMAKAGPQLVVGSFSDEPPWIVVDQETTSIVVAGWPGRLWQVEILRKAPQQPLAYAKYTRATAVRVLRELPLQLLFPNGGFEISKLLDATASLSLAQVENLHTQPSADAAATHDRIWDRWLGATEPGSPYLGQPHAGTLAIGSSSPHSPAGNAPSVLCTVLGKRARHLSGNAGFVTDGDDESFAPPWSGAFHALLHAVLGYGAAPSLATEEDRDCLTRAYHAVVASDDA